MWTAHAIVASGAGGFGREDGNPLTDRERDVLRASADGATIGDIAAKLHLSEGTVRNRVEAAPRRAQGLVVAACGIPDPSAGRMTSVTSNR